jgi:hypothetical protein
MQPRRQSAAAALPERHVWSRRTTHLRPQLTPIDCAAAVTASVAVTLASPGRPPSSIR